ncbi:hypothetical protein HYPSUDRAFT_68177 [Hypholoma sublateritium FD-334 SS-4]|uniref:Uncharacterized protein n=1 Tax=Hypholoma sublateritium (strain FD-334 SS-4) TaxID=945553 RepID=A0A0D2L2D7_HYPSF|nr:hypothetical protein HYPSUDRAFT_68177 [Hypholoma sublateritium FD-334 SS-4]
MAGSTPKTSAALPADAIQRVTSEARKEGVFAGLTSGLASAVIGSRLFSFKRNTALFCGVLSGVLSGVLFTQAFKETAMAQLHAEEARLRYQHLNDTDETSPQS